MGGGGITRSQHLPQPWVPRDSMDVPLTLPPPPAPTSTPGPQPQEERKVSATLLVPFTEDSSLQQAIQKTEDEFSMMAGGDWIIVVEKGGDKLTHMLCNNDPWAAQHVCTDNNCVTCKSRSWLKEERREAQKSGVNLPKVLLKPGSSLCRREGTMYTLYCLDCAIKGRGTYYQGESAQSARQRQGCHVRDLENGVASSPLVDHAVRVHGRIKPVHNQESGAQTII